MSRFVKEKRQKISPNFNFLGQLYEYEKFQMQEQQIKIDENNLDKTKINQEDSSTSNENNESSMKLNGIFAYNKSNLKKSTFPTPLNDITEGVPSNSINLVTEARSKPPDGHDEESSLKLTLAQRKKKFVFQFSSSNLMNNSSVTSNENSALSTPIVKENVLQTPTISSGPLENKNSFLVIQSPSDYSLPSPSQAFSKFNLNSPTTNKPAVQPLGTFFKKEPFMHPKFDLIKSLTENDLNIEGLAHSSQTNHILKFKPKSTGKALLKLFTFVSFTNFFFY